jgi:hypothetical protein
VLGLLPIPLVPEIRTDAAGDQPTPVDDHSGRCPCHVVPIAERMATEEELARIRRELEASGSGAEASDPGMAHQRQDKTTLHGRV